MNGRGEDLCVRAEYYIALLSHSQGGTHSIHDRGGVEGGLTQRNTEGVNFQPPLCWNTPVMYYTVSTPPGVSLHVVTAMQPLQSKSNWQIVGFCFSKII